MRPGGFFPTNPDLADILGDTDFDFENFYFLDFLGSQLGPGLGPAWAHPLGPSLDQNSDERRSNFRLFIILIFLAGGFGKNLRPPLAAGLGHLGQ